MLCFFCGNRTGHAGVRDERCLDMGWVMAQGGNAKAWMGVVGSGVGGAWAWDAVRGKTQRWQGLGY